MKKKRDRRKLYKQLREKNRLRGAKLRHPALEVREDRKKGIKRCPRCKTKKPFKEFYKTKHNKGKSTHCIKCMLIVNKKYNTKEYCHNRYLKTKDRLWKNKLQRDFGITSDEYSKKLKKQRGKCAICDTSIKQNGKNLAVDHNHKTKKIRGLLCNNCNVAIGFLKEDIQKAKNLIKYLKKWKRKEF